MAIIFHNPKKTCDVVISSTSKNKWLKFNFPETLTPLIGKVIILNNETIVDTLLDGNGLTYSDANKTVSITLQGADYVAYVGKTLKVHCSFLVEGDVEIVFNLKIEKSLL